MMQESRRVKNRLLAGTLLRSFLVALTVLVSLIACGESSPKKDEFRDRILSESDLRLMNGEPDPNDPKQIEKKSLEESAIDDALSLCVNAFDSKAFERLENLCDAKPLRKNPQAMYMLAMSRLKRKDNQVIRQKGRKLLRKAASNGYAEAQYELGLRHLEGMEMSRDAQRAQVLFEQSCEGQYGPACDMVGIAAMRSYAFDMADEYFDKALSLGSILAPYYKASTFEHGREEGLKNHPQALKLYRQSADLGSRVAQYRLFYAYYSGDIVEKDFIKAQAWLYAFENDLANPQDVVWNYDVGTPTNADKLFKKIVARADRDKGTQLGKSLKKAIDERSQQFELAHRFERPKPVLRAEAIEDSNEDAENEL